MGPTYLVIIGDIVHSRSLQNRYRLQTQFEQHLKEVQSKYNKDCVSPLTLTIGDEFQTVLQTTGRMFAMLQAIEISTKEFAMRFGFGAGGINTAINRKRAIGMDGPAFHSARQAIEEAKRMGYNYYFNGGDETNERRINILLEWIGVTWQRWTYEKKKILHYNRQGWTQQKIAKELSMSQSAISQHINAPYFKLTEQTQHLIEEDLERLIQR